MPKKSSSKPTTPKPEDPVAEEKNTSSTPKKPCNEIDDIFGGKKRKKPEQGKVKKQKENEATKPDKMKEKKKKTRKDPKDSAAFVEPPSRSRKRTNDGLTIYTEEDLGIGSADAGGTPLCPFDCSCCF